ncbi:MAG: SUMF1/EgtB/PvdO family nonheme iron enzyme [Treponema sp.]|nr:SUMF1/EgtB/PvdO family nonheme iron enzyme [Candidatus Treponema caballi]
MKNICKKIAGAALVLLLLYVMTGCPHDSSDNPPAQPTPPAEPPVPAGFVKINGGTVSSSFGNNGGPFYNASEQTPVTVNTFYMAETELTYAKWYEVYTWAISDERRAAMYTFANEGSEGYDGTDGAAPTEGNTEPVTCVSWRDAVVWCNAASEKDGLTPVYWLEGTTRFTDTTKVLRFAEGYVSEPGDGKAEKAVINESANGYRLPTETEWE